MPGRLRRTGAARSLLGAVLSVPWAYAWMVPMVIALRLPPGLAVTVLVSVIAVFVGLYVVGPLRSQPRRVAQLRFRPIGRYVPWLTVAAALKLFLMLSTLVLHEQLASWRILPRLPDDPEVVSPAFLAHPLGPVALLLAVAVMAPLIEEFAFRGRLQRELERLVGAIPAIVFTAAFFSLLHGRIDAAHHLVFGLFAGWVVWRTGSIWTAVYMHALNNAAGIAMLRLTSDWFPARSEVPPWLWPYAVVIGALAMGGLLVTAGRIHRVAQVVRPRASAWSRKRCLNPATMPAV